MLSLFVIGGTLGSLVVCSFVLGVLIWTEPIVAVLPVATTLLMWWLLKRTTRTTLGRAEAMATAGDAVDASPATADALAVGGAERRGG